ncbi:MAG TPA: nitroreductase [Burkholderiaceae bacterium]
MNATDLQRDLVDRTIASRRSIRQFLPDALAPADVLAILDIAARSPSGHNAQAWNVHVLTGAALRRLGDAILAQLDDPDSLANHRAEFDSYPSEWVSPYIDRRRQVGKDMYTLLGIPRGDAAGMRAQLAKNYRFFDAPVGLIFTLQRIMVPGSVLDLGMFMQSVMLAARARAIDTCPQAAFAPFHRVIAAQLSLADDQVVICGMSMGHADADAAVNQVVTHREPASSFTTFYR